MIEELLNYGVIERNTSAITAKKKCIITGLPRGGTTAVAAALKEAGYSAGTRADQVVMECTRLSGAIEAHNEAEIRNIVQEYDAEFDRWFLKRPQLYRHIPTLRQMSNFPVICIFRDPLAVAVRGELSEGLNPSRLIDAATDWLKDLSSFSMAHRGPTLLLSYEKLMMAPEDILKRVFSFLGVEDADHLKIGANLSKMPKTYLRHARKLVHEGRITKINGKQISGWIATRGTWQPVNHLDVRLGTYEVEPKSVTFFDHDIPLKNSTVKGTFRFTIVINSVPEEMIPHCEVYGPGDKIPLQKPKDTF